MTVYHGSEAQALPPQRLTIDRVDGEESILIDNTRYYKDLRIGKIAGFSRPRNIRATIKKMMKDGEIVDGSLICLDDDDGNQIYYLDQRAGMKVIVGVRGVNEQMIMSMLGMYGSNQDPKPAAMSLKDALSGYDRTINFMASKTAPRAAKVAKLPQLEIFARSAGIAIPDISELLGPDQPRLEGV